MTSRLHTWRGRLAALLLLSLLPLQGVASLMNPLVCHTVQPPPAATADTHQHGHDHAAAHPDAGTMPSSHGGASGDYAGHLCCHHVFAGVPTFTLVDASTAPSAYLSFSPPAPERFVPDRLQRPPRG